MYKFLSYLNGLKDGVLLTLVPISIIIGAITMTIAIIQNKSMRSCVNEFASEHDDRERISYSDYAKPNKHKRKMGFSID